MKRLTILAALAVSGLVAAAPANVEKGKQTASTICAACHAADGNSTIAAYPKLSSQHADYIFKQTIDIKKGDRNNGSASAMAPMVQNLSDEDIRNVSTYYATQNAKAGEADPSKNPELGAKIYRGGLPDKKIPACMSCHGPSGAGMAGGGTDISAYPRLSGQHSDYVVAQLKSYANGERKSPNSMMEDIASRMNEADMQAVGSFIQGLK